MEVYFKVIGDAWPLPSVIGGSFIISDNFLQVNLYCSRCGVHAFSQPHTGLVN